METIAKETLKKVGSNELRTLSEKYKNFQNELSKLVTHRQNLIEEQRQARNEYHGLLTQWQNFKELDMEDKAKALEPRLRALRSKTEGFKIESNEQSLDVVKEKIALTPDNQLHILADEIYQEGIEKMETLKPEIELITNEIEEAKKQYLGKIEKAGNIYRKIWDIYLIAKRVEGCLPPEKRNSGGKKPRNIPNWNEFEISEKELFSAYGRKPFVG